MSRSGRRLIDQFEVVVDIEVARRAAGGRRRLRAQTEALTVALDNSTVVHVKLVHCPTSLGGARPFLVCPTCRRRVLVLRRVDGAPWLACRHDLRLRYSAKYRSQLRRPPAQGGQLGATIESLDG